MARAEQMAAGIGFAHPGPSGTTAPPNSPRTPITGSTRERAAGEDSEPGPMLLAPSKEEEMAGEPEEGEDILSDPDVGGENSTDLDGDFVPDARHHDIRRVFGLLVPKKVPVTDTSRRNKTAGMDPDLVKHWQLLFGYKKSYDYRHIANGRFTLLKVLRSVAEFHSARTGVKPLRPRTEDDKTDVEQLIQRHLASKNETALSDKEARKTQRKTALIEATTILLEPWKRPKGPPEEVQSLKKELEDLKAQLLEAKKPAGALPTQPPKPTESLSAALQKFSRQANQERVFANKTSVTGFAKGEVNRLTALLELTRDEKMMLASTLAELVDMTTPAPPQVTQLEVDTFLKEVKKVMAGWGIPQSLLIGKLVKAQLAAALELLALATVVGARVLGE